jgi:hypothetical protein
MPHSVVYLILATIIDEHEVLGGLYRIQLYFNHPYCSCELLSNMIQEYIYEYNFCKFDLVRQTVIHDVQNMWTC